MNWPAFKEKWLVKFWSPFGAIVAAGVLAAYYFGITHTFWAVTGEFTRWGGHALQLVGAHPEEWGYFKIIGLQGTPFDRVDGVMVLGMFAGALAAALAANNVKLRRSTHKIRIAQALVGGFIAGWGARLAMGCNLAAFFTGIPQFSLHAWIFLVTTAVGTWFGAKVAMLPLFRVPVQLRRVSSALPLRADAAIARRRFALGAGLMAVVVVAAVARSFSAPVLGLAALFGVAFGVLIERGQVCFTSAFRDLWLTGRTLSAKAIIAGMAVSTLGTFAFVQAGIAPKIYWAGPNVALGGLLFGFGIVLAGGCETGWMYRAMEGQTHYWMVGVGNILGATVLAWQWDALAPVLATPYPKVNLLASLGPIGGLVTTYLLLGLCMAAVVFYEKRFFLRRRRALDAAVQTAGAAAASDAPASVGPDAHASGSPRTPRPTRPPVASGTARVAERSSLTRTPAASRLNPAPEGA